MNMNKATLSLITLSWYFSSQGEKKTILSTKNTNNLPNSQGFSRFSVLEMVCGYKAMKHTFFVLKRTSYVPYWSLLSELCGRYVQSAVLLRL